MGKVFDSIIIGGGQAGLAVGYYLKQQNVNFKIFEKSPCVGDSWKNRYDSLKLFATRRYSSIPGMLVKGDQAGYPVKDEIAKYLIDYVDKFNLPVQCNVKISSLKKDGDVFCATTESGEDVFSKSVILATGGFEIPNVLGFSKNLSDEVKQFTPLNYQRPSQVPKGRILIAGDGATGRQVAKELSKTHEVILATGAKRNVKPQQIFGKDYFWWLDKLGILNVTKESKFGKYMIKKAPFPGEKLNIKDLKKNGVRVVGLLTGANGNTVSFSSGETIEIKSILWALGYKYNFDWIDISGALNDKNDVIEHRGISPVSGLYTIGRTWQWTRGSATLTGVGKDSKYITEHMKKHIF